MFVSVFKDKLCSKENVLNHVLLDIILIQIYNVKLVMLSAKSVLDHLINVLFVVLDMLCMEDLALIIHNVLKALLLTIISDSVKIVLTVAYNVQIKRLVLNVKMDNI